jgi:hypothetical protein
MIFIVIPALFLRFLLALVNQSIINFQSHSMTATATAAVSHADSYIYTLTTISIFLVVALIGGLRQRHSEGGMSQEQKIGLVYKATATFLLAYMVLKHPWVTIRNQYSPQLHNSMQLQGNLHLSHSKFQHYMRLRDNMLPQPNHL